MAAAAALVAAVRPPEPQARAGAVLPRAKVRAAPPGVAVGFHRSRRGRSPLTARTADLVSLLEAVVSRDRQVRLVWPKRQKREFAVACALALLFALLAAFGPEAWLRAAGLAGCVAGVVMYIVWMHSVLRFTRS